MVDVSSLPGKASCRLLSRLRESAKPLSRERQMPRAMGWFQPGELNWTATVEDIQRVLVEKRQFVTSQMDMNPANLGKLSRSCPATDEARTPLVHRRRHWPATRSKPDHNTGPRSCPSTMRCPQPPRIRQDCSRGTGPALLASRVLFRPPASGQSRRFPLSELRGGGHYPLRVA